MFKFLRLFRRAKPQTEYARGYAAAKRDLEKGGSFSALYASWMRCEAGDDYDRGYLKGLFAERLPS